MKKKTFCLRCHQKCRLNVDVVGGRIVRVEDASLNRNPPCMEACPLSTDIPRYVRWISEGRFDEALSVIRETNPLPGMCSWICHRPCEAVCSLHAVGEPVAIRALKRAALDYASKRDRLLPAVPRTHSEEVAVIGSGPAGLTAAHDMVRAGYGVTVYEADATPGGIPATVIPEFILPQAVVLEDVHSIEALGVKFILNTTVGVDVPLQEVLQTYDAVILAGGCSKPMGFDIPGRHLDGIYDALTFLRGNKEIDGLQIHGNAVIIGGGDTAVDAARVALRAGAGKVAIASLEDRGEMPAQPKNLERAEAEGVSIHPRLAPQRFVETTARELSGIVFQRVDSFERDLQGGIRYRLSRGKANRLVMPADAVITAIGQTPDWNSLVPDESILASPRGTLAVDPETMATRLPGVFGCGEMTSGPSYVVESMAAGRRAAQSLVASLEGDAPFKKTPSFSAGNGARNQKSEPAGREHGSVPEPTVSADTPGGVAPGFGREQSIQEAERCLDCVTCCPKGATLPDVMYHPDRLLYPLKRAGERGEGKWTRISWEEALGTIAEKLKFIQERHGPAAVAVSCGSGQKHIGVQALSICKKMWPTPNTHWGRYTCDTPDDMNNAVTFGDLITYEFGPDYDNSRCMVFWGSNPHVGTPAQTRSIHRAIRKGAKVMVMDPRPTPIARRADLWLRIRPGTDMALALAMQHVIIQEELYDAEFVEKWCVGFERVKAHVQDYPPQRAAEITGLKVQDIFRAARMYAKNRPGCIYVRLGAGGQQVTSTQTGRAISILIALCGNVDVPGGNLLYYRTFRDSLFWHVYDMGKGIKGPAAVEEMRTGAESYPLMHHEAVCDMPGIVQGMANGDVKALWCLADNLVVAEMDSRKIWRSMRDKVEFVFVSDFFMTPTAELADMVLPAAFYTEIDTLAGEYLYPANHIMASPKLVEPPGECKDDREVAIEIAKRMGRDVSPWNTVKDYLDWRLRYVGVRYDQVCRMPDAQITLPREFRRFERSDPAFYTASGKIELFSSIFDSIGVDPLPGYQEPPESPESTPRLYEEFPLIYTHYRLWSYMHSEGRQIAGQRSLIPEPYLQLNPDTAARYGLCEGEWVDLETPRSRGKDRIRFKVHFLPDMHPDVVAGPHAWWFPEKKGPDHGCFESNINTLLRHEPPYEPVVGNVQCRAILCRITKAEDPIQ